MEENIGRQLSSGFSGDIPVKDSSQETLGEERYKQIGQLKVANDFLKKSFHEVTAITINKRGCSS